MHEMQLLAFPQLYHLAKYHLAFSKKSAKSGVTKRSEFDGLHFNKCSDRRKLFAI